jgi:transposase
MRQRQYKRGQDRQQALLLPPKIEEYVSTDNPVRAIDAYVESLDLRALGFTHTSDDLTPGQPAFAPKSLLKLYLYGYLHQVRSSRRLAAECQRNLEVIWLEEGLQPGYKTIADFRKDNLQALKALSRDFVQLCKELDLFGGELIAMDGAFMRGNVAKKNIYTAARLKQSLERIDRHIREYLEGMDKRDGEEGQDSQMEGEGKLKEKLEAIQKRQKQQQERLKKLKESGKTQMAEVDEDARLLTKSGQD